MADLDPFDRQELESLLTLVRERRTYVVEHTQAPEPVREQLLGLENKLVAQLGAPGDRPSRRRSSGPPCCGRCGLELQAIRPHVTEGPE